MMHAVTRSGCELCCVRAQVAADDPTLPALNVLIAIAGEYFGQMQRGGGGAEGSAAAGLALH